jgi:hypothetical protein
MSINIICKFKSEKNYSILDIKYIVLKSIMKSQSRKYDYINNEYIINYTYHGEPNELLVEEPKKKRYTFPFTKKKKEQLMVDSNSD